MVARFWDHKHISASIEH